MGVGGVGGVAGWWPLTARLDSDCISLLLLFFSALLYNNDVLLDVIMQAGQLQRVAESTWGAPPCRTRHICAGFRPASTPTNASKLSAAAGTTPESERNREETHVDVGLELGAQVGAVEADFPDHVRVRMGFGVGAVPSQPVCRSAASDEWVRTFERLYHGEVNTNRSTQKGVCAPSPVRSCPRTDMGCGACSLLCKQRQRMKVFEHSE